MPRIPMITIVDDDQSVREATRDLVRSLGYGAVAFASADDFLNSSRVDDTSCLITDVEMPGVNGIELQSSLAAQGRQIPIIFITAYPSKRVRTQVMEAGAFGFFAKPFDETLIDCLAQALAGENDER